jgi:hypothetical protein
MVKFGKIAYVEKVTGQNSYECKKLFIKKLFIEFFRKIWMTIFLNFLASFFTLHPSYYSVDNRKFIFGYRFFILIINCC